MFAGFIRARAPRSRPECTVKCNSLLNSLQFIIYLKLLGTLSPLTGSKTLKIWHRCQSCVPLGLGKGWNTGVAGGFWSTDRAHMYESWYAYKSYRPKQLSPSYLLATPNMKSGILDCFKKYF